MISLRYMRYILTPLWYCWPGLSHGALAGGWGVSGVYTPHPLLFIYIANGRNGIQCMHIKEHSFWLRTWYPYKWEMEYSCKETQLSMLYVISLLCWVVIAQGGTEKIFILPINVSLNKDVNCILLLECDSLFSTADRFKTNTLYMYVWHKIVRNT